MFHFTTPDMQVFHFTTYMQVCGVVQEPWIGSQSVLQIAKKNKQQIERIFGKSSLTPVPVFRPTEQDLNTENLKWKIP